MTNNRFFKVDTAEQFKILKYININFNDGALELELLRDDVIGATDRNGTRLLFYYDRNEQKVKSKEMI